MNPRIRSSVAGLSACAVAALCATAASAAGSLSAKTYAYPGYDASWTRQAGLADTTGGGGYGLVLSKTDPSAGNVNGGGVYFSGAPSSVRELGFDMKIGSRCDTVLMFRITTSSGSYVDIPCSAGTQTALSTGWTRVRFDPAATGYDALTVSNLKLRLAIPAGSAGSSTVDNLDVDGTLIDR
jgi:hypothetical protein